jgi:hypothetical protein
MPAAIRNDFKKAMSAIVLTAGAALADSQRATAKASAFNRRKADQAHGLAVEFCRLLVEPVNEHGQDSHKYPASPKAIAANTCRPQSDS